MARITTEEVERLLKQHKTVKWIAEKYKVTRQAIYCHIDKIKKRSAEQKKSKKSKPQKNYNALIDWHVYNEGLVKRGEFLLDLGAVKNWTEELNSMNKGKAGARFIYPESYIYFLLRLKNVFKVDYRTLSGMGRRIILLLPTDSGSCHYSTLQRRLRSMQLHLERYLDSEDIKLAVDASGLKTSNRGEYRLSKYRGMRKQFVKLHIGVDTANSEIVSCDITSEAVSDGKKLKFLVEEVQNQDINIKTLLGDRGYDGQDYYGFLSEENIESGIKPRATLELPRIEEEIIAVKANIDRAKKNNKNVKKFSDRLLRLEEMKNYFSDSDKWKEQKQYGERWKSEIRFSVFKRLFGDYVYSKNDKSVYNEVLLKVNLLNYFNASLRKAFHFKDTS